MDFLIRMLIKVLVFNLFEIWVNSKHVPSQGIRESEGRELRKMLHTVMEQNRRLVVQNERLQQVWFGMKEMCKAVTSSPCDCMKTQVSSTNVTEPYTHMTRSLHVTHSSLPAPSKFPLQIMSISSSGSGTDPTQISVNYTATPVHTTEWIAMRKNRAIWRTAGTKSKTWDDKSMFTSTVGVEQFESLKKLFFYLYNDDEIVSVTFNLTELHKAKQQSIIVPTLRLFDVHSSYLAPFEGDLNITAVMNKSTIDLEDIVSIDGYFSGVNTTSSEMFEVFSFNSEDVHIDQNSAPNVVITVRHPIVQFGGQLTLRYEQRMDGMIKYLYYGPLIKIFTPGFGDIIPNNTLGIFPLSQETFVYSPSNSLMCAAMGKPRPDVSVLKIASDGKMEEMPAETFVSDKYMTMKILTLSSRQQESTEGQYTCRVSNGQRTIDATTDVIVHELPVFDDTMTGVVQNDSKIIVISCKAKGKPNPDLTFRLYGDYGPDLVNAGIYKVWRADVLTSRVTLTIPAADGPDIHTVFCAASQKDQIEASKKIEVYPGIDKGYNWELYDRLLMPK